MTKERLYTDTAGNILWKEQVGDHTTLFATNTKGEVVNDRGFSKMYEKYSKYELMKDLFGEMVN